MSGRSALGALLALALGMTGMGYLCYRCAPTVEERLMPYYTAGLMWWCDPPAAGPMGFGIEGDLVVKEHRLVRLRATGAPEGAAVIWDVYPEEQADVVEVGGGIAFSAPPGSYTVRALAISAKDGKTTAHRARVKVLIEATAGPGPNPPPSPAPKPPLPPVRKADPVGATLRIQFNNSSCTATVIGLPLADGRRHILTAAHCIPSVGSKGTAYHSSGRRFGVVVRSANKSADLAWLTSTSSEPSLPFAVLATVVPKVGTKVWHNGYGWDRPRSVERGEVRGQLQSNGQLPLRLVVSSGDSGSGIFRSDNNDLVAVVCCSQGQQIPGKGLKGNGQMWGGCSTVALRMKPMDDQGPGEPAISARTSASYMAGEGPQTAQEAREMRSAYRTAATAGGATGGLLGALMLAALRILERWLDRRSNPPPSPAPPSEQPLDRRRI